MTDNVLRLVTKDEKLNFEKISTTQELIAWLSENMEDVDSFVFLGVLKNGNPNFAHCTSSSKDLIFLVYVLSKYLDIAIINSSDPE